ncbi:MAG: glycosyltransferase family 9 protein, partial [Myxococcota bacterium]
MKWEQARRILCVRLDAAGDVLMTTPAIRALKESGCGRQVTLLISDTGAEVAAFVPEVDEILTYRAPWMKSKLRDVSPRCHLEMVARLSAGNFDAAVIFTVYSQSPLPAALLCFQAGIPLRLAHCRENPYHLLTDWEPETEPEQHIRHEVRRQLDLVSLVGARTRRESLSFAVPEESRAGMSRKLLASGLEPGRPWLVVHPGGTARSRRYPTKYYSRLLDLLFDRQGHQAVVTGTRKERSIVNALVRRTRAPVVDLCGSLDLGELGALLQAAPLLVSGNTGPVHMAAAFGTPVVDLYALTNPQHAPWAVPSRVLYRDVPCRWCYKSLCPEGHNSCL